MAMSIAQVRTSEVVHLLSQIRNEGMDASAVRRAFHASEEVAHNHQYMRIQES